MAEVAGPGGVHQADENERFHNRPGEQGAGLEQPKRTVNEQERDDGRHRGAERRIARPAPQKHEGRRQHNIGGEFDAGSNAWSRRRAEHALIDQNEERMEAAEELDKAGDENPIAAREELLLLGRAPLSQAKAMQKFRGDHRE